MSITRLSYVRRRSSGNVLGFVTVIWLLSAAVSIPPLIGWKDEGGSSTLHVTGRCTISQDLGYTVYSTSAAFYLPLVAIVVIYAKIYRAAQSTIRKKKFRQSNKSLLSRRLHGDNDDECEDNGETNGATNGGGGVPTLMLTRETGSAAHAIDVKDFASMASLAPTDSCCYTYNSHDTHPAESASGLKSSSGLSDVDGEPDSCYGGQQDNCCYVSSSPSTPFHESVLRATTSPHNEVLLVCTKQGSLLAASFLHRPSVPTLSVSRHQAALTEPASKRQSLLHAPLSHNKHTHGSPTRRRNSADSAASAERIRLVALDSKGRTIAAACRRQSTTLRDFFTGSGRRTATRINRRNKAEQQRARREQKRERKAARTLAIITGVFVASWLPFFIMAVVAPFCGEACALPGPLMSAIVWLGYLNSLVNPAIYTIFNPDFRVAFRRMLCGNLGSRQSSTSSGRR